MNDKILLKTSLCKSLARTGSRKKDNKLKLVRGIHPAFTAKNSDIQIDKTLTQSWSIH